jgi:hypothetical protein
MKNGTSNWNMSLTKRGCHERCAICALAGNCNYAQKKEEEKFEEMFKEKEVSP